MTGKAKEKTNHLLPGIICRSTPVAVHTYPRRKNKPPAVPRSRLCIRVLTKVEQNLVKNDYEREALELLKKQNFSDAKRFETYFLLKTGLKQD